jgi:hypothetical protein
MTFQLFIVKKMSTFLDETIHITSECVVHFYDHRNKMMLLMKPSILANFSNALNFAITPIGQLMTFEVTVSRVGSITITLVMKT